MPDPILPQLRMHLPRLSQWVEYNETSSVAVRSFDGSSSDRLAWERIVEESFQLHVSFAETMERDPAFRPERVLFALVDGEPAATASAWHRDRGSKRTGYLHMVGTRPSVGARGLGRAVCAAALIQMAKENRFDSVLETDDFRHPAIKLYLSMGYRPRLVEKSQIARWREVFRKIAAVDRWPDAPAYLTHEVWPADQATIDVLAERSEAIADEPTRLILLDQIGAIRRLSRSGAHSAAPAQQAAPVPGAGGAGQGPLDDAERQKVASLDRLFGAMRKAELTAIGGSLIEQVDLAEIRDSNAATSASEANHAPVLDVRDFGAAGDNRTDDGPAVAAAIAALAALPAGATLRIPAGVYRIGSFAREELRTHVWLSGLVDKRIEGDGPLASVLLGTHVGSVLRMEDCRNTVIRGIGLDLDPLPFTQGRVTAVDPDAGTVEWEAAEGWSAAPDWLPELPVDPAHDLPFGAALCREAGTGRVLRGTYFPFRRIERRSGGRALLSLRVPWFRDALPFPDITVGDVMTLHSRGIPGAQAAAWITANEHCELREVGVYASYHHAFVISDNTAMRFIDCTCEPMPNTGRLAVSNADGFHIRNNRIGPHIYGCTVRATNDDTANLYTRAVSALYQPDGKSIVVDVPSKPEYRANDWQTDGRSFRPGDLVAVIHATDGTIDALGRITAVEEAWWRGVPRLRLSLSARLPTLLTRESLGKRHPVTSNMEFFRIGPEEVAEHMVVNLALKSDAFVVRNNRFGENHINTMKLKASNGIIESNRFDRPTNIGISFCMRLTWQEAFAPRNVLVSGNVFVGCNGFEATIDYPGGRVGHGPEYIDGVEVVDNRFEDLREFGFRISSVHRMRVAGNVFQFAADSVPSAARFAAAPSCRAIDVEGNLVDGGPMPEFGRL